MIENSNLEINLMSSLLNSVRANPCPWQLCRPKLSPMTLNFIAAVEFFHRSGTNSSGLSNILTSR